MGKDNKLKGSSLPKLNILSSNDLGKIIESAFQVLEHVGHRVPHNEALELFKKAGCKVENEVVYIPAKLIENSLNSIPKAVSLYNRNGELSLEVGGDNVYFGAGADAVNILDSFTGERREFVKNDVAMGALLQDALENIDYVMCMGTASDVPSRTLSDIVQFEAMLFNTVKPIQFSAFTMKSAEDIIEMASTVAGDENELKRRPFCFYFGGGCKSPLSFDPTKIDRILYFIDKGIPYTAASVACSGGTAPVTIAGQLTLGTAELFTSAVLSQIRREGAPIFLGLFPLMMDMKSAVFSYSSPEFLLANSAIKEIFKTWEVPIYGTAGCTDSKLIDEQSSLECYSSILFEALSRSNLNHDCGFIESGMTSSYDMLLMADEAISMVRRILGGIQVGKEEIALDVIAKVGHDGNFVSELHTLQNFRKEQWQSKLLNREAIKEWAERGKRTLSERINSKVKEILMNYKPLPLESSKKIIIKKIIDRRLREGS